MDIYRIANEQGIGAITCDYLFGHNLSADFCDLLFTPHFTINTIPKSNKISWVLAVENIIKQYHRRKALSIEIADIWAQEGI